MGVWAYGRMGGASPRIASPRSVPSLPPAVAHPQDFGHGRLALHHWQPGGQGAASLWVDQGLPQACSRQCKCGVAVVQGASRRSRPARQRLALHLHAACAQLRLPRLALASRLCRCATWTAAYALTIPTSPRTCSRDGTSCRRGRCAGISLAGLPAGCGHLGARHLCCRHACLRLMQGSQPRHLVRTFALPEPLLRPSWPLHRWRARHRPGQAHQTTLTTTTRTAMARTPPASLAR